MKILAHIEVEKIVSPGYFSFRSEVRELEVIRVIRYRAAKNPALNRWHYQADVADHPDMHPDSIRIGVGRHYRVNIMRSGLNPKWRPPEFAPGEHVFEVQKEDGL